jgi:hypothetical protein
MYLLTYKYTYTYVHMHIHIDTYISNIHKSICINIYIHMYTYTEIYIYIPVRSNLYCIRGHKSTPPRSHRTHPCKYKNWVSHKANKKPIYVCMYMFTYRHMYIYIFIHIDIYVYDYTPTYIASHTESVKTFSESCIFL